MPTAYRIAIGVTVDPSGAKSGTTEVRSGLASIGAEAEAARPKVEGVAKAVAKVDATAKGTARKTISEIGDAATITETKLQKLIGASVGLHDGAANQNMRQWQGALASEGLAVDNLRAKYDPAFAAISRYKSSIVELKMLHAQGAISSEKFRQAMSRERQEALASIAAFKGRSQAMSGAGQPLRADQKTNLLYQGYDTAQSLALGMPFAQVALQQGPQVIQIFGGVGNAARAALAALTPVRLAIGGTTAVLAIGATAWNSYLASIKGVETAASGVGRATAGTSQSMETAARNGAAAANISVSSARALEVQFLRTGKIGSQNFEQLIAISKNFGATIGVSADEAGAALAEMFADPTKAIDTLYRQYGLIDAATAEYAQRLTAQNRITEAQRVLLDALPSRLANASEATTALGRAWDGVSKAASDAYDWMGRSIDRVVSGPSPADALAAATEKYETARRTQTKSKGTLFGDGLFDSRVEEARVELERLRQEDMERRGNAIRDRQQEERRAAARGALDAANSSPATAAARARRELEDSLAKAQGGLDAPGLSNNQQSDLNATIDAKKRALETLIPVQERANQLAALNIRIQTERNPVLLAGLMADRERLQLAGEEVTTAEASSRIAAARNRIIQETLAASQLQSAELTAEVDARRRLNDQVAAGNITASEAEALLRTEIQLRPLAAAAAAAQGEEQKKLADALKAAKDAAAASELEQRRASAIDVVKGQEDDLERLRLERTLVGATTAEREKALAVLETEQMIRARGYSALSAEADAIRRNAREIANQTEEVAKATAAWQMFQSAGETAIDNVFGSLLKGDFKGALKGLLGDVGKFFQELGTNSIKNMLLGGDRPELSDVLGRFLKGAPVAANQNTPKASGFESYAAPVGAVTRMALPDASTTDIASYIAKAAASRGIDPAIALAVAKSEGGVQSWNLQSSYMKNGIREPSFGPFQLYKGGGLGNAFQKQTGLDPAQATSGPAGVDFALDYASKNGWGAWYGAGKAGISKWQGIGKDADPEKTSQSFEKVATSAQAASTNVGNLSGASATAVKGAQALGEGLGQAGQNLANMFPAAPTGGGGGGFFSSLLTAFLPNFVPNGAQSNFAVNNPGKGLYDTGGWTGDGARDAIAGYVHGQEYVVKASVVAQPGVREYLENLNAGRSSRSSMYVPRINARRTAIPSSNSNSAMAALNGHVAANRNEINVYVDNPRGDRDIEAAVDRGVSKGIRAYDKNFAARAAQVKKRPYVRGQ